MIRATKIRTFVDQIVTKFHPEKVLLFGSSALGKATSGSDVDLFVIMDTKLDNVAQEVQIRKAIPRDFPLDLIVMNPQQLSRRMKMGDPFIQTVLLKGKVLYEKDSGRMD